jgi:thioredoxin reductase
MNQYDVDVLVVGGGCAGVAAGFAAGLCLKNSVTPRQLDGQLVREAMIDSGIPLDKAPVRLRGDMMGIRLPDGRITMRFGSPEKRNN